MSAPAHPQPAAPRVRPAPLGLRDTPLLAEALATLAWASAEIANKPFAHVAAIAGSRPVRGAPADTREIDRVVQAVQAWARRVPWRAVCFQQGLAVHLMLRRRGVRSRMHYGVSQTVEKTPGDKALGAHVWIGVGDRLVIGGEEAARFACLATYPATID